MEKENFIKQFKKEHKFLFIAIIASFIMCFPPSMFFILAYKELANILFLIPFILVILISAISYFTFPKFPKLTKCLSAILNTIMLIAGTYIIGVFSLFLILFSIDLDKNYTKINQYQKARSSVGSQYRIKHFPKTLPDDAFNIHFYKYSHPWFGSEGMLLEFNTNKKYINDELKKYKFIKIDKPGENSYRYNYMLAGREDFTIQDFTFYVINDRDNENPSGHHFPYHYGIGVNKELSQIIYYYNCPD